MRRQMGYAFGMLMAGLVFSWLTWLMWNGGHSDFGPDRTAREEGSAEIRREAPGGGQGTENSTVELESESGAIALTERQEELLNRLLASMETGDLASAASFLEQDQEEYEELFYETYGEERYLWGKDGISAQVDGHGLVLRSPSLIFYGNFKEGAPQGSATALQEIVLEEPRYDYSIGSWKDGKMDGYGISGYFYYAGAGEKDGMKTEKSGLFRKNLMEGEIRYTSVDRLGGSVTWKILAEGGVTKLDDRWKYREESGEYMLLSENDHSHAYLLNKAESDQPIWKNRLLWE